MDNSSNEPLTWGFKPLVVAGCALGAALLAVAALVFSSAEDRLVGAVAAVVVGLAGLAALAMRHRLRVDAEGLRVRGPFRTRCYPWARITSISAPTRRRRGLSSVSVEIEMATAVTPEEDTAAEDLLVFGRLELGADPAQVAAALRTRWSRWAHESR